MCIPAPSIEHFYVLLLFSLFQPVFPLSSSFLLPPIIIPFVFLKFVTQTLWFALLTKSVVVVGKLSNLVNFFCRKIQRKTKKRKKEKMKRFGRKRQRERKEKKGKHHISSGTSRVTSQLRQTTQTFWFWLTLSFLLFFTSESLYLHPSFSSRPLLRKTLSLTLTLRVSAGLSFSFCSSCGYRQKKT